MPHVHDKIYFTSEVFIVYGKKVLLRKHDKYGIWLSVGGHIELNEDPNEAAIREVKEEIGLKVKLYDEKNHSLAKRGDYQELIAPQFMNRHRINKTHEHITLIYFGKSDTDKLILSKTEKSKGCKWFSKEELNSQDYKIKNHIRKYALSALEKLAQ